MVESVQMEGNITSAEAPVEEVKEDRPEWLPEKFKTPEDLSKAYSELESQFTKSRQAEAEQTTEQPTEQPTEDARQTVEDAGLDFDALQKEFADTGGLTDETYKSLADKGIPKEMVDSYVKGQQALASDYENELYSFAGGKETYSEMSAWAAENLSEGDINAYNNAINSGDSAQARLAIDGLVSRYKVNGGAEPSLVGGRASASVDAYESMAQLTADMSNPLYAKDPAFRDKVQKKLSRSNVI